MDIDSVDAELAALEAKRAELLLRKQSLLEFVVEVSSTNGKSVILKTPYNEKFVEMVKQLPTRIWNSYTKTTGLGSEDWGKFQDLFSSVFPSGKIVYLDGADERIKDYLNRPDFKITKTEKHIVIDAHPKVDTYPLRVFQGAYTPRVGVIHYPIADAWRVLPLLEKHYSSAVIVWEDGVKELCSAQADEHNKVAKYHSMKDTDEVSAELGQITLRPFQKVGVAFAKATGGRALIADPMGLGKTMQGLATAISNGGRTLIVCPASLKHNWANEIHRTTGKVTHLCSGREPDKQELRNVFASDFVVINYDILGANYEVHNKELNKAETRYLWVEFINLAGFTTIILDEAHKAKNLDASRTQAVMRLTAPNIIALTGTPVLNRPGELWPTLHLLRPQLFPFYETFLRDFTYDGKRARNVEQLREMLSTIMIRRERKDVQADLPPINRVVESLELSEAAKKQYMRYMAEIQGLLLGDNKDGKMVSDMLELLLRLKQVCARDKVEYTCELAKELNEQESGEWKKVIIFSQFTDTVASIKEELGSSCLTFTGATDIGERSRLCQQFQTDENIKFLVCTTQVAAEGLTLTQAGFVIFNDLMWTPAAHQQAEGRAYGRLNDAHSITSYYPVAGKVEEWIMELLAFKMKVIEETVEGKTVSFDPSQSIVMELIDRLKLEG